MLKLFLLIFTIIFIVLAIMFDWLGARELSMSFIASLEGLVEFLAVKGDQFQAFIETKK